MTTARGYVDESGDTGYQLGEGQRKQFGGSSTRFQLALVIVPDPAPLLAAMAQLRRKWRWRDAWEIKFSQLSHRTRSEFFDAVAGANFDARYGFVEKSVVRDPALRSHKTLVQYLMRRLLDLPPVPTPRLALSIDEQSQDKKFQREFCRSLERALEADHKDAGLLVSASFCTSQSQPLVQLADMIVGAVSHEAAKGANASRRQSAGGNCASSTSRLAGSMTVRTRRPQAAPSYPGILLQGSAVAAYPKPGRPCSGRERG